jgi:hypothetical protein
MGAIAGLAALTAAAAMVTLASSAGAAQATPCTGVLPSGIYGGVVVPAGATCIFGGPATVHGGISVEPGASLIIGPATVDGGISANQPASIVVHGVTINGGIAVHGGFGTAPEGCDSEDCVYFTAIEDSNINGGATVDGYTGFWLGFIRNHVNGGVNLSNNNQLDPDASEYVTNTIHGGMACFNNTPAPHGGDSGGAPNVVTGQRSGQCFAGFELLP